MTPLYLALVFTAAAFLPSLLQAAASRAFATVKLGRLRGIAVDRAGNLLLAGAQTR